MTCTPTYLYKARERTPSMCPSLAFTSSLPLPSLHSATNPSLPARRKPSLRCQVRPPQTINQPRQHLYSRRVFNSALGALCALSFSAKLERVLAGEEAALTKLRQIRTRVDDIDGLITAAKWDSVRTVLATNPVVTSRDTVNKLIAASGEDLRGAIVGFREDLLSAIRLLDTSVYSNVFIGEDRQILGTKVDFDVPRTHLRDVKDSLDALIEIAES